MQEEMGKMWEIIRRLGGEELLKGGAEGGQADRGKKRGSAGLKYEIPCKSCEDRYPKCRGIAGNIRIGLVQREGRGEEKNDRG